MNDSDIEEKELSSQSEELDEDDFVIGYRQLEQIRYDPDIELNLGTLSTLTTTPEEKFKLQLRSIINLYTEQHLLSEHDKSIIYNSLPHIGFIELKNAEAFVLGYMHFHKLSLPSPLPLNIPLRMIIQYARLWSII